MLKIDNIKLQFGELILLKDTSLRLKRGKLTGLVGQSGLGKTSLLNGVALKLKEMSYDSYTIDNQKIQTIQDLRGKLLYLQQENKFFEDMSVKDNYILHQYLCGIEHPILNENLVQADKMIKQLSGGELNQCEFGKLFLNDYDLILVDETFANMDKHAKHECIKQLKDYVVEHQCYCLVIFHDQELQDYFDEIYEIDHQQLFLIKQSPLEQTKATRKQAFKLPKAFYLHYYKSKLKTNKARWLLVSLFCVFISAFTIIAIRQANWPKTYTKLIEKTIDQEEYFIDYLTQDRTGNPMPIDLWGSSFPMPDTIYQQVHLLPQIEEMYEYNQFLFDEGDVIISSVKPLDSYCTEIFNDEGIYVSKFLYEEGLVQDGKVTLHYKVPVAKEKSYYYDANDRLIEEMTNVYVDKEGTFKVKGVLNPYYYNYEMAYYVVFNQQDMVQMINDAKQEYTLKEDEIPYTSNVYTVYLKNQNDYKDLQEELFKIDENILLISKLDCRKSMSSYMANAISDTFNKGLFIGAIVFVWIVILFERNITKNNRQHEDTLLQFYGLTKKEMFFKKGIVVIVNTLISTVMSSLVVYFIIKYLNHLNILIADQVTSPISYMQILVYSLGICFIMHSIMEE